jgi:putative methyltransferase (TIGR04325 family)
MLQRLLRMFPSETISGYEHPELVDVIFQKTLAYRPKEPWPEIAGARAVLDFGGGCGLHYKQANSPSIRWAVVETPAMVARAAELQTDKLRFFTGIDEAADWLGHIEVMHSNGAVQYTAEPLVTVRRLCELRAARLLWYRCALSDATATNEQISHLADNGPGFAVTANKNVSYSVTTMTERDFLNLHGSYELIARGADWFQFRSPAESSTG